MEDSHEILVVCPLLSAFSPRQNANETKAVIPGYFAKNKQVNLENKPKIDN